MKQTSLDLGTMVLMIVSLFLALPNPARAHCDTLGGPVVMDAQAALEAGDVTPVLKWVRAGDEGEVRAAFERALAVRDLGPEAKNLADTYFFETLVRLHRAGEGEPFSGLKPAGAIEPVVLEADRSLDAGSADALAKGLAEHAVEGVRERFARALEARKHAAESVQAGREYVEAYVDYVHYVERIDGALREPGQHHAAGQQP